MLPQASQNTGSSGAQAAVFRHLTCKLIWRREVLRHMQEEIVKKQLRVFAATAAFSLIFTALPSIAAGPAPQDREHRDANSTDHPDYSNNSYYALGNREGYQDYQRKQQRKSHHHHYRNDDDRAAHDYGYQQWWQGQRGYNSNTNDRHVDNTDHPH